jgi:hypothetical protein
MQKKACLYAQIRDPASLFPEGKAPPTSGRRLSPRTDLNMVAKRKILSRVLKRITVFQPTTNHFKGGQGMKLTTYFERA